MIAADSKIWKIFLRGFLLELLTNAFPFVKEGSGIRESLEFTSEMVDQGYSLLIAPEGLISPTGELQPFQKGTGLLSVEFGVDVIGIKIQKEYRDVFPDLHGNVREYIPRKRQKIQVKIAKPLRFSRSTDYGTATKIMEETIKSL